MKGILKIKKLTYLAVLEPSETGYGVYFPDLSGCISLGDDVIEAQTNAKEALELHIYSMMKDKEEIPAPSPSLQTSDIETGSLIIPVTIFPRIVENEMKNRRVKTTVTIPSWLNDIAENSNMNYSRLLEVALKKYLDIK